MHSREETLNLRYINHTEMVPVGLVCSQQSSPVRSGGGRELEDEVSHEDEEDENDDDYCYLGC